MKKQLIKSDKVIKEKSAGLVVFYQDQGQKEPLFLLLQHSNYFGLPKGHIEKKETEIETALRETEEETGLKNLTVLDNFKESIHYFFKLKDRLYYKEVVFFLAESNTKEVKISFEHLGYKWLTYKQAIKTATYDNIKQVLKKAYAFIKNAQVQ